MNKKCIFSACILEMVVQKVRYCSLSCAAKGFCFIVAVTILFVLNSKFCMAGDITWTLICSWCRCNSGMTQHQGRTLVDIILTVKAQTF